MIAGYLRVSTKGQSVEMQRSAIEQAVRARGASIDVWFSEKCSGARTQRAQLNELRQQVRRGLFSTCYCYRLDRLSRGDIRFTFELVDEFRRHGCTLETIADGLTFGGPTGDIVLAVLACLAKMERETIGSRISDARKRVERDGGSWGRPREITDAQARDIRRMVRDGRSIRQIAVALKIPRSTVQAIASRKPAYMAQWPEVSKKGDLAGGVPVSR